MLRELCYLDCMQRMCGDPALPISSSLDCVAGINSWNSNVYVLQIWCYFNKNRNVFLTSVKLLSG